ncbi:MAG: hypothetical protein J0I19_16720 [Alphaproteobacteria bacterium]|nr:hypothetical protein [Alphaproteobacteria bacterium]
MRDPAVTVIVSLPAVEAAKLCVIAYEQLNAFWASQASPDEVKALQALIDRKEGEANG